MTKVLLENVLLDYSEIRPTERKSSKGMFVVGKGVTFIFNEEQSAQLLEIENTMKDNALKVVNKSLEAQGKKAINRDRLNYSSFLSPHFKTGDDSLTVKLTRVPNDKLEDGTTVPAKDEEGNYKELIANRFNNKYQMPTITRTNGEVTEYIPFGGSIVNIELILDGKLDVEKRELKVFTALESIKVVQDAPNTGSSSKKDDNLVDISADLPSEEIVEVKKATKTKTTKVEELTDSEIDDELNSLV